MKTKLASPKKLLEKTGYTLYLDKEVLATIPRSSDVKDVEVFTMGKHVSNAELLKEYESRGLVPATLEEILSVKTKHYYVATIWDTNCYLAFCRWDGGRHVDCDRGRSGWNDYWWFAGVSKSGLKTQNTKPSSETESLELPNELVINGRKYQAV